MTCLYAEVGAHGDLCLLLLRLLGLICRLLKRIGFLLLQLHFQVTLIANRVTSGGNLIDRDFRFPAILVQA